MAPSALSSWRDAFLRLWPGARRAAARRVYAGRTAIRQDAWEPPAASADTRRGPTRLASASEGLLESGPRLRRQARHRVLGVGGGEAGEEVSVAGPDLQIGLDRGRHLVGGADGLIGPRLGPTVRLEQALEDALSLCPRVADHDGADDGRALDFPVVAPDRAAVLLQDRFL